MLSDCNCPGDTDCNNVLNTFDSNDLSSYLFEYADPNDAWSAPIWPPLECSDLDVDGELSALDMNILLIHLFTYGDPNNNYETDVCYDPNL